MCLYPTLRKNPKYTITKKNGGNIPPIIDMRVKLVATGCGNCIECKKQKARNWQLRLEQEARERTNGKFITLTFSNESIAKLSKHFPDMKGYELDNAIATKAMRMFLERWRKRFKKYPRRWFVTELGHGKTEHIHMHGIIFTDEENSTIRDIWSYGYIWPRYDWQKTYVTVRTARYMTKYMMKVDKDHKHYKPKILCTKGIGEGYMNRPTIGRHKYKGADTITTFRNEEGAEIAMPIYWRNKIYTEEEREKLWLHLLDKQKRYVMGEEVDISGGLEPYYDLLKYYQKRNEAWGYGNDEIDWERRKYESDMRQLKNIQRIKDGEKKLKKPNAH